MSIRVDRWRKQILVAALLPVSFAGDLQARSKPQPVPPDLQKSLDAYNQATMRGDTSVLAALVTDDYRLVNSDASVQGKESYLADFRVPGFHIDPYMIEQPFYRTSGEAALTAWEFHLGWTQGGQHQERHLRISHFWLKRDGRWKIAHTQLTRIPE